MNVFLRDSKNLLLLLSLFLPLAVRSQNFDPLVKLSVIQGQNLVYNYQSLGSVAQTYIVASTNHCGGTYQGPIPLSSNNYRIVYANPTIPGKDTLTIHLRKPPQGFSTYRIVEITVVPSMVNAENDFVTTPIDQSISISVAANDYSNRNVLIVREVATTNNGVAIKSGNNISFTPRPGFSGIANFDYVICDDLGTCDKATVHVCVGDPYSGANDTLEIITIKNNKVPVLTPLSGYSLSTNPAHGTLQTVNGILNYSPNQNYTGTDFFRYTQTSTGNTKTLKVDVLNVATPNQFVQNDVAYTIKNAPKEVDVLANDLGTTGLYNVQITNNPDHGTLTNTSEGVYIYSPNSGFEGVDEFFYSASPNSNGTGAETGKVFIIVSNQNPRTIDFDLVATQNTPLIINYNIPVADYDFTITSQGEKGTVIYYPGEMDTIINGQNVKGYNLLIYYPDNGELGIDEFELEYCVTNSTNCPAVKVYVDIRNIAPPSGGFSIGSDCVWAGDSNKDGIVDMRDLLPIGWCVGDVGKPRPNSTINPWYGQNAPNWGRKFRNSSVDLKHIDTNGDSLITALDTVALNAHYQKTNSLSAEPVNFPTDIPLFFGNPDTIYVSGPGDIIRIPIILGDPSLPALDLYGLTFSIDFDANIIDANQSAVRFEDNSWMSYSSPVLGMIKKPFSGRMDAGFTRTNGVPSNGYGKIGVVDFIIIDDLDIQKIPEKIHAKISGSALNGFGQTVVFKESEVAIRLKPGGISNIQLEEIELFPNPAENSISVRTINGSKIETIEVIDISGKKIMEIAGGQSNKMRLEISSLTNGIYAVRVKTEEGLKMTKKLEVLR